MKTWLTNIKLWHALAVQGVAIVALFTKFLSGGEFIALTTIVLGIHTAGEVVAKRSATP